MKEKGRKEREEEEREGGREGGREEEGRKERRKEGREEGGRKGGNSFQTIAIGSLDLEFGFHVCITSSLLTIKK